MFKMKKVDKKVKIAVKQAKGIPVEVMISN